MKNLRWQILVIILALIIVAILIIRQKPESIFISPKPTSGGVYTEGIVGSMERLNPLFELSNPVDQEINRLLFCQLIKFDTEGLPVPDLAESWGVSIDGTIYNISIRANAIWHDGAPITSDDVLFTIDLMRNRISSYPDDVRNLWAEINVVALDNKTLRFELPEPFAPFLDYLSFGVLPKHILASIPVEQLPSMEFNLNPIGCGPFQFDTLKIQDGKITGLTIKKFPGYFGKEPYIEEVSFVFFPSMDAEINAFKQGEILGINQITSDYMTTSLAEENLAVYSSTLPRLSVILLNHKNPDVPFLQEKDIRKALLLGINRQWIIDNLLQGQAIVADSPILSSNWAYFGGSHKYQFDPDEAISILKANGYELTSDTEVFRIKDNQKLEFTLLFPDDIEHAKIAQYIQSNWKEIGVSVILNPVPYEEMIDNYLGTRNFQAALVDIDFRNSHDPDPYPFWHQSESAGGQNFSQWENRSASEYIEQARVVVDTNLRAKLYRNFQILFSKEIPALILFEPIFSFGVDYSISGIQASPIYSYGDKFANFSVWFLITRNFLQNPTNSNLP